MRRLAWISGRSGTRSIKTAGVLVEPDVILTTAVPMLDTTQLTVNVSCCGSQPVREVIAYDLVANVALLRLADAFVGFDTPFAFADELSMKVGAPAEILYRLPIDFDNVMAYATFESTLASQPEWTGQGPTPLFPSNEFIKEGSIVLNEQHEPVAMVTGWGGAARDSAVWLDDALSIERRQPIPIDAFTLDSLTEPDRAIALAIDSVYLRAAGRHAESLGRARAAIQLNPDLWLAHYNIGVLNDIADGDPDQSIASLQRSIQIEDEFSESHYSLGLVHYKTRRPSLARESFERAVTLDPGHVKAWNMLGIAIWDTEGAEAALPTLKQGSKAAPVDFDIVHNLISALRELGRNEEALELLAEFVARVPDNTEARKIYAHELYNRDLWCEAIEHYRVAYTRDPDQTDLLVMTIACQIRCGRVSDAQKSLERLREAHPENEYIPQLESQIEQPPRDD